VRVVRDGLERLVSLKDERSRFINNLQHGIAGKKSTMEIKAPMPGLVTKIYITAGLPVHEGMGVIILEAMKMENEIRTPAKGIVTEVLVKEGATVEKGDTLVRILS
ncbi:MAG: acetyl-CoA carboxylase biotin carboxyl carrier protein subunit, partial [Bacteroidota bacterium]